MNGQSHTRNAGPNTPTGHMPTQMAMSGMTPKEIISIVRRHIFLIVFMTVTGTVLGGTGWYLLQRYLPQYQAQALIAVSAPGIVDPDMFRSATPQRDIYLNFRKSKAFSLSRINNLRKLLRESDAVRKTSWFTSFGNNDVKRLEKLEKRLSASARKDLDFIIVSMRCGKAGDAALIANEMVKLFLKSEEENAKGDIRKQLAERKMQLGIMEEQLSQTEGDLNGMRQGTEFANLDAGNFRGYLDEKLEDVEIRRNELASRISSFETTVEILRRRAQSKNYDDVVKEQADRDGTAISLRLRIIDLEMTLAERLTRFGENHREIKDIRNALEQTRAELVKRDAYIGQLTRQSRLIQVEDSLLTMAAELETLHEQRVTSRNEYRALSLLRADYMKLVTQKDKLQENVAEAETFIRKLNVLHDDTTAIKVQLGSIAVPPDQMVSPKILVFVPGGFVLGFMAGIGLAFLIELLNDLLRTPSDVMKHLRIPLLGTICHKDEDRSVRRVDLFHVVQQAPYSILSECYRQLRINLKLSDSGGRNKSLLITSGATGDGKTTVAVNLCYTLVADDRRVVLVDTNFRKPSTQAIFPKDGEAEPTSGGSGSGLSNYLMGQCDITETVRTSGIESLDVIDSGLMPLNTAELLGSDKMKNLIANLSKQYDYVIIDGPPLLISEAKILADETDGTIVVFNTATTRRGAAQRTLRELREINVNLVGTVLVGVRSIKGGYFGEVYRSYQKYQHSAKKHASLPA